MNAADMVTAEFTHPETVYVDDGKGGYIIKNKADAEAAKDKVLSDAEVEKRRKKMEENK